MKLASVVQPNTIQIQMTHWNSSSCDIPHLFFLFILSPETFLIQLHSFSGANISESLVVSSLTITLARADTWIKEKG